MDWAQIYKKIFQSNCSNFNESMAKILLPQQNLDWVYFILTCNMVTNQERLNLLDFCIILIEQINYRILFNYICLNPLLIQITRNIIKKPKRMYTQDQFEPLLRNSCKTDIFQLTTNTCQNILQIHLKTVPNHKQYFRYSANLTFEDLDIAIRQKFDNLKNLQAFLTDIKNINVDIQTGIIELVMSINLFNGKSIVTKLGQIKLRQHIFDAQKCLQRMIVSCEQKDIFTQINYRNTMMEVASMLKILFKKFQILEENQNKQTFFSFKDNNGKSTIHSLQNSTKSDKNLTERKLSANCQFYHQHQHPKRVSKQDIKQLRIEIDNKFFQLREKQQKSEIQLETKILELRKQLKNLFQNQSIIQSPKQFTKSLQNYQLDNFKTQHKSSPSIKMQQNCSISKNSSELVELIDTVERLKYDFQNFNEAVMIKMQSLGQTNQILQDKLKKVVVQLDIRLEQKNLKESIDELKNKIIDVQTPFFEQFQMTGTKIEYKGQDSQNTMLLGKIKISQINNKFSIQLSKTLVNNIQIGLVDSTYRFKRDCWSQPNFILYVGWNSTIYEGPCDIIHKQGQAITEGDVVTVRANIQTGLIEWLVAGNLRAKVIWQKLKDKSISWVPMVRFFDHGDVISWMTDRMLSE